jgi:hypothetical protein
MSKNFLVQVKKNLRKIRLYSRKKKYRKTAAIIVYFLMIALAGFVLVTYTRAGKSFSVIGMAGGGSQEAEQPGNENISPLSGIACDNYNRRPFAVMLANDTAARPLSGLSEADMVFEMQVVQNNITRLMAVFVCNAPREIGSIRSARHPYIPLAMGLDAIYAHWGGSHFALDKLNAHIMDNIDALKNPFGAYYRKSGAAAPHNGFTSIGNLENSAEKMDYDLSDNFSGYPHYTSEQLAATGKQDQKIKINYTYPWNVEWDYRVDKNSYFRLRGNKPEIDKNNGQQVEAKNVIVMYAKSTELEGQYNDVVVSGSGDAVVYQNGGEIKGTWKKDPADMNSKLYFLDENGQEIKFVPGQIWVEIIESGK